MNYELLEQKSYELSVKHTIALDSGNLELAKYYEEELEEVNKKIIQIEEWLDENL